MAGANAIGDSAPSLDEGRVASGLVGEAPPSPSEPIGAVDAAQYPAPPLIPDHPARQVLRFNQRQIEFVFWARRKYGEVFCMRSALPGGPVITSHPDHVRSLFTAPPETTVTLTRESSLRPIVGPNSVITAIGERHMRQRKLLLPYFRGETISRYTQSISDAVEREIDGWPVGEPFALAPRMQAITLDVIMAGVFGIGAQPRRGTPEYWVRFATKRLVSGSTKPIAQIGKLLNLTRDEPVAPMRAVLSMFDRPVYAIIAQRRRADDLDAHHDILSLLLRAETEDGETLSDEEIRNELLALVFAGHETTAYTLAWTWERLVRAPDAHERLREAVRSGEDAEETIEATITESMRSRPAVPIIGRRLNVPWRLGEYGVGATTPVMMSALLLHHREDLYPEPFQFRPERWIGRKPRAYEWIPFGGGIRRCVGAALTTAEQRAALEAMARRLDIEAAEPEAEHAVNRNVMMVPAEGARIVVRSRLA